MVDIDVPVKTHRTNNTNSEPKCTKIWALDNNVSMLTSERSNLTSRRY